MRDELDDRTAELPGLPPAGPSRRPADRAPRWHAPRAGQAGPLCGQASATGEPSHRIAHQLPVTCAKCTASLQRAAR